MPITTTSTPASHATNTSVVGAASSAAKSIFSKIGLSPEMLAVVLIVFLTPIIAVLLIRSLRGVAGIPAVRTLPFIVYDPNAHVFRWYVMMEIAPNIFATRDGKLIAMVPRDSKPVNIEALPLSRDVKKSFRYAYYGHKIGSLVLVNDPEEEKLLSLFDEEKMEYPVRNLADLLAQLYNARILRQDVEVSPSVRLIEVIDPKKAGERIAKTYGRFSEEALIDITAMTGRRKEFEQQARALVELEERRLQSVTGAAAKLMGIIIVVVIILAFLLHMFS